MIYSRIIFPITQRIFWRNVRKKRSAWKKFSGQGTSVHVQTQDGTQLELLPGDHLSEHIYCGSFEWAEREWLRNFLKPGNVFYDVGANVGLFSLLAAKKNCRVFSFEPSPVTFARLEKNISLNGFNSLITAFPLAASDQKGQSQLFTSALGKDAWNSMSTPPDATANALEIETVQLDDFIAERKFPLPDVMKIDVEGWEPHVIRGAQKILRDRKPALLMEFTAENLAGSGSSADELASLVKSFGYALYEYNPRHRKLDEVTAFGFAHKNLIALART